MQLAIADSYLHVFEGTSHNYWVEQPEEFVALVLDWFNAHGGPPAH